MGLIDQLYDLQNQLAEIEEAAKKMIRSRDDRIAALEAQNEELVEALKEIMCEMPIEPKLALTKRIIEIVEAALAKYKESLASQ